MDYPRLSKVLTASFQEGEQILWIGHPEDFPVDNPFDKKRLLRNLILTAVVVCATLAVYLHLSWTKGSAPNPAFFVLLLLLIGFFVSDPLRTKRSLTNKFQYFITDRRFLLFRNDLEVFSLGRRGLKVKVVDSCKPGCVNILMGSYSELSPSKYTPCALTPARDGDSSAVIGLEFFNVKDSADLRQFFP